MKLALPDCGDVWVVCEKSAFALLSELGSVDIYVYIQSQ